MIGIGFWNFGGAVAVEIVFRGQVVLICAANLEQCTHLEGRSQQHSNPQSSRLWFLIQGLDAAVSVGQVAFQRHFSK
jgi:hypothetical protein